MDYDFLRPEDQLRILRGRLAAVEQEHFNVNLDDAAGVPYDPASRTEIEERLVSLRKKYTEVEAEVNARKKQ